MKLSQQFKDKEILYKRLILFTLGMFLIILYLAQIFGLIGRILGICMPFFIGGILCLVYSSFSSSLMDLGVRFFHLKETKLTKTLVRILVVLLICLGIAAVVIFLVPSLVNSMQGVAQVMPRYIQKIYNIALHQSENIAPVHQWLLEKKDIFMNGSSIMAKAAGYLFSGGVGAAFSGFTGVISNTVSWIWIGALSVVFSLLAFFNQDVIRAEGKLFAKSFLPDKRYNQLKELCKLIIVTFSQYLKGTITECFILATLVGVFSTLFGVPNAALIGVFIGCCALVPMFGATVGAVIATLFLFIETPAKAITFVIVFLCIQQVEGNFIYPTVVGKSVGLPPIYVFVSITIGSATAGLLGIVLSIPVASVIYALLKREAALRLEQKQKMEEEQKQTEKTAA